MSWRRIALVASVIMVMVLGTASTGQAASVTALDPTVPHYGKTNSEWSARWWQWALSIPVHAPPFRGQVNHPLVDLTGSKCAEGQSGPVWFLGGAFFEAGQPALSTIERGHCAVPKSKALYFPLLNIEASTLEGNGTTEAELRSAAAFYMDLADNLSADVDGNSIQIVPGSRVQSPLFKFTLPRDDILSFIGEGPFVPGTYFPAAGDGYYVMLAPLSSSQHRVHFHGEIPAFDFSLDVTYDLTVT